MFTLTPGAPRESGQGAADHRARARIVLGVVDMISSVARGADLTEILAQGHSVLLTVEISRMGFQLCSNTQVDIYGYTESGQAVSPVRLLAS